jgi:hypothetical protein
MQRALFQWITLATPRIPQLALAFHPANGGKRDAREAARLKGLGVRPGVPDVMIPGRDEYGHIGIAVELKAGSNTTSDDQERWLLALHDADWRVEVVWDDWTIARQAIADYFGVKP